MKTADVDYDFLDFGASKGDSLRFAQERLGGKRGLGIDLSAKKIAAMRKAGLDCLQGDITRLELPRKSVRFVTMSHVLEHLPDLRAVRDAVASAARVAEDFLYIQGPSFDDEERLAALGFKFYWSDWRVHTCHLTVSQLRQVLSDLGLSRYVLIGRGSVDGSDDPAVHPLDSPADQHEYDVERHPPKPKVRFPRPLQTDFVCAVALRKGIEWRAVLRARTGELLAASHAEDARLYRQLHFWQLQSLRRAVKKVPIARRLFMRLKQALRAA